MLYALQIYILLALKTNFCLSFKFVNTILVVFLFVLFVVMAEHNILGYKGEMLAVRYLQEQGFAIREQNWRCGHKEIDIVAQERDVLVFVEVKTRTTELYGDAVNAVTPAKMHRLILAADTYVKMKRIDFNVRFDIITIVGADENHRIEHIRNAFYPGIS